MVIALVVTACLAFEAVPARGKESSPALDMARQLNQVFIEVAERVSAAVVVINVAHKPDYSSGEDGANPWLDMLPPEWRERFKRAHPSRPSGREPVFDGMGSGVVIREDGYILTNRHVVDGAEKIRVRFKNGKEYDAEIRGVDPQSDIAVIKIDAKDLATAKLGDSDKARVGEFAIAIGAPLELDYSVTFGHVSAKGRSHIIPDMSMDQDFIQTDANINPGNSGGPLINIDGDVIGINTLIKGLRGGIGFAIPSNLAREVADKLIADGKFTRAWLGLEIRALSEDPDFKGMVKGVDEGVVVRGIVAEGPAAKSDLKVGDVVTAVDGKRVATSEQLRAEVRAKRIDSPVTLDVVRNDKKLKVKVKAAAWPEQNTVASDKRRTTAEVESNDLGLTVKPMSKELAKDSGIEMVEGLLVTQVEPGSVAMTKGIQSGDIITEIGQRPVATLKDYRAAIRDSDLKKGIMVTLVSQGVTRLVILKDSGE